VIIRWTPEPGEPVQEFSFKPETMLSPEAEPIEAAGNGIWDTWDGWLYRFKNGNKYAERVALWTCLKRADPALQLSAVSVRMDSLSVFFDLDEIRTKRQQLRDMRITDEWTVEMRDRMLAMPYLQLPEGEVDPAPLPQPAEQSGKTPTPSDDAATDGTSPDS
jgi:hypothetical protein